MLRPYQKPAVISIPPSQIPSARSHCRAAGEQGDADREHAERREQGDLGADPEPGGEAGEEQRPRADPREHARVAGDRHVLDHSLWGCSSSALGSKPGAASSRRRLRLPA